MFWDYEKSYYHYSFEEIKNQFNQINHYLFKTIYWLLAPYFSIPILSQEKVIDYEKQQDRPITLSELEHEYCVSALPEELFKHNLVKTGLINKTKLLSSENGIDLVEVKSMGFDIVKRVEYVSVMGGDGYWHDVPVKWDEYIPHSKTSKVKIKPFTIDQELEMQEYFNNEPQPNEFLTDIALVEILE